MAFLIDFRHVAGPCDPRLEPSRMHVPAEFVLGIPIDDANPASRSPAREEQKAMWRGPILVYYAKYIF